MAPRILPRVGPCKLVFKFHCTHISSSEPDKTDGEKASVTIRIDEVDDVSDYDPDFKCSWDGSSPFGATILSTNAPSQARLIYRLGSIVPLLLAAILENVDVNKDHLELHDR